MGCQGNKIRLSGINKFFRASNASAHRASGTGLGLYIVKQSVEKLGGTIDVDSKENEGSAFIVNLPYKFNQEGK